MSATHFLLYYFIPIAAPELRCLKRRVLEKKPGDRLPVFGLLLGCIVDPAVFKRHNLRGQ